MKYVYILVGNSEGFFQEQTLVSIVSLRHVMPSAKVSLIVDDRTDSEHSLVLNQLKEFSDEYVVQKFDDSVSNVARSRILKTTMRFLLTGDFLYVDSDTVWASPVDESVFTGDFMGVLDGHRILDEHPLKSWIEQDFFKTSCNPGLQDYVNGGVLFVRDSLVAKEFFKEWHEKWKETSASGYFIDQPSLNYAIKKFALNNFLLPHEYNVQISRDWKYFAKAKIVHFYTNWMKPNIAESKYLFQKKSFWNMVKEFGLTPEILDIIKNPLTAFDSRVSIYDSVDDNLRKTQLYGIIRGLFEQKLRGVHSKFTILEKVLKFFCK